MQFMFRILLIGSILALILIIQNGVTKYSRLAKRRDLALQRVILRSEENRQNTFRSTSNWSHTNSYETSKTTYRSIAEITRSPSFLAYPTPIQSNSRPCPWKNVTFGDFLGRYSSDSSTFHEEPPSLAAPWIP